MRHIQDKQIDELFRNQFENAEIEPSSGLWANIEDRLEVKPIRRKLPVYWMAAAAVMALIITEVLFTKPEKIQLHGADQTVTSVVKKTAPVPSQKEDVVIAQNKVNVEEVKKTAFEKTADVKISAPVLAANLKKELTVIQPMKPDTHLHVVIEQLAPVANSNPVVLASVQPSSAMPDEVVNENDQTEKRGIRNVGDLINYVVDKVDKREQKILQFKTDEDDNSSLVAINIGFIKFNKKHK